jgi:hypothetical protein
MAEDKIARVFSQKNVSPPHNAHPKTPYFSYANDPKPPSVIHLAEACFQLLIFGSVCRSQLPSNTSAYHAQNPLLNTPNRKPPQDLLFCSLMPTYFCSLPHPAVVPSFRPLLHRHFLRWAVCATSQGTVRANFDDDRYHCVAAGALSEL